MPFVVCVFILLKPTALLSEVIELRITVYSVMDWIWQMTPVITTESLKSQKKFNSDSYLPTQLTVDEGDSYHFVFQHR